MKFVIRDDDLNYFSKPEYIEKWYGDIFKQKITVGFATVPFVIPFKKSLRSGYEEVELKEYPIHENKRLIEYIKSNELIEILQHGYNHEIEKRKYEYGRGAKLEELIEKTLRGKEELEKAFRRRINIFVPPHDSIYNHGIFVVEAAGMNIIRGTGSKNFLFRLQYFTAVIKMAFHRLQFPNKQKMPAYPYIVDFGKHKEAYSNRLSANNLQNLLYRLDYIYRKKGNFIITAHLHSFNQDKKDNLIKIIAKAREMGFEFVKPSDLFKER